MSTMLKVQQIIADALYVDVGQVSPEASLMRDLGAESIDFLDIVFRLEKSFSIRIPKGDVEKRARGSLSEEEFAIGGQIQQKGLDRLLRVMPELDATQIQMGLTLRDLPSLFTVATFERMVREQLGSVASEELSNAPTSRPISRVPARAELSV